MTDFGNESFGKQDPTWHIAAADYYTLLALLYQIPHPDKIEALCDPALVEDYQSILAEMGETGSNTKELAASFLAMQQELAASADPLSDIRQEYTRAFAHPRRPPIKLYEGLFVDDERERLGKEISYARLFVSPAAMDAERQYARAGVKVDNSEKRISADCVTTELQFMSHLHTLLAKALIEGDADGEAEVSEWLDDFRQKHIGQWMPRFFERCAEETQHDFYRLAGKMGLVLMRLDGVSAA